MNYTDLQLDVLTVFAEAQHEASNRRAIQCSMIWGEMFRSGRTSCPPNQTTLGRLPALVTCARCRTPLTSVERQVLITHHNRCRP